MHKQMKREILEATITNRMREMDDAELNFLAAFIKFIRPDLDPKSKKASPRERQVNEELAAIEARRLKIVR
jgi:hypothetical protein